MKNYLPKKFFIIRKKILENLYKINKTKFNYKIIIQELVYLILKHENLLFDLKNKKGNPTTIVYEDLLIFLDKIQNIKKFGKHEKNLRINKIKFIREKSHHLLFNKLWVNFSLEEYKKERLGRYLKRIRINNLKKMIIKKNIVDFGCGHGNFLISCSLIGAKKCIGVDYGEKSINFARSISQKFKLNHNVKFYTRSVYETKLPNSKFDFAIQNGVFHHLDNETKAYKEMYRVLKKGGFCWIYTDGGGGLRDYVGDLSQEILKDIDKNFVVETIRSMNLTTNKEYHLSDSLNALYRHTDLKNIKNKLTKIGFKFVKQLKGGYETDFDKPFIKDKYFNQKFGSGDLRLLFKK